MGCCDIIGWKWLILTNGKKLILDCNFFLHILLIRGTIMLKVLKSHFSFELNLFQYFPMMITVEVKSCLRFRYRNLLLKVQLSSSLTQLEQKSDEET